MNRAKKEEKKRGKPYPSAPLYEREWFDLINYYEDTTKDERLKESLAPRIRALEERINELKSET